MTCHNVAVLSVCAFKNTWIHNMWLNCYLKRIDINLSPTLSSVLVIWDYHWCSFCWCWCWCCKFIFCTSQHFNHRICGWTSLENRPCYYYNCNCLYSRLFAYLSFFFRCNFLWCYFVILLIIQDAVLDEDKARDNHDSSDIQVIIFCSASTFRSYFPLSSYWRIEVWVKNACQLDDTKDMYYCWVNAFIQDSCHFAYGNFGLDHKTYPKSSDPKKIKKTN